MQMIKHAMAISCLMSLTACNTVAGVGKDISTSADWAKQKISGPNKSNEDQNSATSQSSASPSGKDSVEVGAPMK
jgi:predicted small secreted protein